MWDLDAVHHAHGDGNAIFPVTCGSLMPMRMHMVLGMRITMLIAMVMLMEMLMVLVMPFTLHLWPCYVGLDAIHHANGNVNAFFL